MTDNMKMWDAVSKTDPSMTKKFTKGGGFSGTAIKPFWLMKRATEIFGPCGLGWGWEELENKMVGGVWCSKVRLWYFVAPASGTVERNKVAPSGRGQIEQWGQTVMEGTNKNGSFVDEEAPKKAVTDAVTKCLSYLGFAGDVHLGLFDDSKYVSEVNATYREQEKPGGQIPETSSESVPSSSYEAPVFELDLDQFGHADVLGYSKLIAVEVDKLANQDEWTSLWNANRSVIESKIKPLSQMQYEAIRDMFGKKWTTLSKPGKAA